jgi:hypothetical protein
MFEYKVLTERDTRFSGKFDLEILEKTPTPRPRHYRPTMMDLADD